MPPPAEPGLLAVASVGSTCFPGLLHSLLSTAVLSSLLRLSTATLVVQFGRSIPPLPPHLHLLPHDDDRPRASFGASYEAHDRPAKTLVIYFVAFTDSIDVLLGIANIVISHAGAGTILASLRPPASHPSTLSIANSPFSLLTPPPPPSQKKHLIIIPNQSLMDNHQSDLATQISSATSFAKTCSPDTLAETLETLEHPSSSLQHQHSLADRPPTPDRSTLTTTDNGDQPPFGWVPDKFVRFLDSQMGFGELKTA